MGFAHAAYCHHAAVTHWPCSQLYHATARCMSSPCIAQLSYLPGQRSKQWATNHLFTVLTALFLAIYFSPSVQPWTKIPSFNASVYRHGPKDLPGALWTSKQLRWISSRTQDGCFLVLPSSLELDESQAACPPAHSSWSDQLYIHQFFPSTLFNLLFKLFWGCLSAALDCLLQCSAILQWSFPSWNTVHKGT